MDSPLIYEQAGLKTEVINQSSGEAEAFFCKPLQPLQPWLTKSGIYILYRLVHMLKNLGVTG